MISHFGRCGEGEVLVLQNHAGQGFHEVEDAGGLPLVLTEGLVVHEEIDGLALSVEGEEPARVLLGAERIFLPRAVGEAEGDVVGKPVVLEEQAYAAAGARLIDEIGAAPVDDLIRALREDGPEALFLGDIRDIVVVDELRVAEGRGRDVEVFLHEAVVLIDLGPELVHGEEKGQGMGVGLGKHFHAARVHELLEALEHVRRELHHLIDEDAGEGEAHLEGAVMPLYLAVEKVVHGQVALLGHLAHDGTVRLVILVNMVVTNVEEGIMTQTVRLMDLEIKANGRHVSFLSSQGRRISVQV